MIIGFFLVYLYINSWWTHNMFPSNFQGPKANQIRPIRFLHDNVFTFIFYKNKNSWHQCSAVVSKYVKGKRKITSMESLHKKRKVWKRPEKVGTALPGRLDGILCFTYFCGTRYDVGSFGSPLVWPNFCRTLSHILQGLHLCSRTITSPIKKI